jgi:tetratricopeptide (TPR) repeat protein
MKGARVSSAPPSPLDGRPFRGTERFELLTRLGEGGYGAVYEAHDRVRDQRVALKVLTRVGPEHVLRFKQEFRALSDLEHPNLVQLGEMFEDEGRWFFTMELVQGSDWLEYVRGPKAAPSLDKDGKVRALAFDPERLRSSFLQLVEGVEALHRGGKVHRDIKPSNIQVTREGRVVLLDFGLVTSVEAQRTTEMLAVGTAAYMAPEQATGVPVGPPADWYSVGVVLYEALTGRLPFTGTAFEMLLSKQSSEPTPPRVLMPELPVELSALCVGLLKPDPASRLTGEEVLRHAHGGRAHETDPGYARHSGTALTRGAPFVGRESERRMLSEVFARSVAKGRMSAVYVHGESGVGKSALVHEFTEEVEATRGRIVVLRGRCYERETVPYKAFDGVIDALTRFLRTLEPTACSALLPRRAHALPMVFPVLGRVKAITMHTGPRVADMDRATLRAHALSALRELFERLAETYEIVIVIDDLQWADAESLALLTELSRPPEAPPLMLIVTARDPEECPVEVQNALDTLTEQAGIGKRIRLEGLPLADAQRLAEALLEAGEVSMYMDGAQIAREAEGHPLFIDALVRYSQEVRLTEGTRPELDDALRFRIAQLDPDSRRLLELCALAAAPLSHKVVADAAGWPLSRASTTIAKLRVLKLVRTSRTRQIDTVETFHDRMRHAAITRLPRPERKKLHRRLGEAIEASDLVDVEAAAFHFREADVLGKAAMFAARAADRAMENLAFDKAARLYREVVELDQENPWEIRMKMGDALANAGRGREAADAYLATLDVAPPEHKAELRRKAAQQLLGSGNVDAGMDVARELLRDIEVSVADTARGALASLMWNRAKLALRGLSFRQRDSTEVSEEELSRVDTLWAIAALGMVDHFRGTDLQTKHLVWALDTGEPYRVSRALSIEAWLRAAAGSGKSQRSQEAIGYAMELAERSGHPHAQALAHLASAVEAYHRGELSQARWAAETAETLLRERCTSVAWEITNARLFGLLSAMWLGDFRVLKQRVSAALRESLERGDRYAYTNLTTSLGYMVSMLEGDLDDAQASVEEAVQAWSQQGFHVQHSLAFIARASLALAAGDVGRAVEVTDATWPELERSQLLRADSVALHAYWLRARAYAALSVRDTTQRTRLTVAERDARRIARMNQRFAPAIALSVQAAVQRARHDLPEAARMLAEAEEMFASQGVRLAALSYGFARGELLGGASGDAVKEDAQRAAVELGIPRVDLAARVFFPR